MRSTLAVALLVVLLASRLAVPLVGGLGNPLYEAEKDKDPTGKPDGVGKPDDAGKPDDVGKPDGVGKPDDAGKPDDVGKPDGVGKPDDVGKPDGLGSPEVRSVDLGTSDDEPDHPSESEGAGEPADELRTPEELLAEAEQLLARALEANKAKRFKEAAELAREAERLARLAESMLLSTQGVVTEEEALEAIDSAVLLNVLAAANLSEAKTNLVETSSFMTRFQNAKELLDLAWTKLEEGDCAAARALAIRSTIVLQAIEVEAALVAENAESLLDTLEEMESDSIGKMGEIFFVDDGSNNTVVQAQGHKVTFSRSSPLLGYMISDGDGEGAFEANVFALIEFADYDGDNEIDEDEVVKVLQLDSLEWIQGQENVTKGEETALQTWYHFLSTEYDIWILMNVFEAPLIKHFSSGNDTVVYFVEGNAMDVKLDLIVNRWPWSSQVDKLALRVFVAPNQKGNIETKKVGTDEEWLVLSSGERSVRIKVVTKAEVMRLDDLSKSIVEVKMSYRPLLGGEILVDFVYPNFGEDTLYHDPQFGIGGLLAYMPILSAPAVILVLGILPIVLLPLRRRLESLRIRAA